MLKEVLARKGITMVELSRMSGVSYELIRKICKGYSNTKRVTLYKLANSLQVAINELEE